MLKSRAAERELAVMEIEVATAGINVLLIPKYFHGIAVAVNVANEHDVKYPTEADAADDSQCYKYT